MSIKKDDILIGIRDSESKQLIGLKASKEISNGKYVIPALTSDNKLLALKLNQICSPIHTGLGARTTDNLLVGLGQSHDVANACIWVLDLDGHLITTYDTGAEAIGVGMYEDHIYVPKGDKIYKFKDQDTGDENPDIINTRDVIQAFDMADGVFFVGYTPPPYYPRPSMYKLNLDGSVSLIYPTDWTGNMPVKIRCLRDGNAVISLINRSFPDSPVVMLVHQGDLTGVQVDRLDWQGNLKGWVHVPGIINGESPGSCFLYQDEGWSAQDVDIARWWGDTQPAATGALGVYRYHIAYTTNDWHLGLFSDIPLDTYDFQEINGNFWACGAGGYVKSTGTEIQFPWLEDIILGTPGFRTARLTEWSKQPKPYCAASDMAYCFSKEFMVMGGYCSEQKGTPPITESYTIWAVDEAGNTVWKYNTNSGINRVKVLGDRIYAAGSRVQV